MEVSMSGNRITINGKTHNVQGSSISVINGKLYVDDKLVEEGLQGIVEVKWEGPLASLSSDAAVTCGDVHGGVTAGSSVSCGSVAGSVDAGSKVMCGKVGGNVDAGSSIMCGDIGGNATAGSWIQRK